MEISEQPRVKAVKYGIDKLSNRELLAILLRCGNKQLSVLELAEKLLNDYQGIFNISTLSYNELIKVNGISTSKALSILAAFELSKRVEFAKIETNFRIDSPQVLSNYLNKKIGYLKQEYFMVIYLDNKNQIIKDEILFIGSLNQSLVHPREIFKKAIIYSSASLIVCHNHPSSDILPSKADINTTNVIKNVGDLVGIPLVDHIIVSHNNYFSFKSQGLI